ncbi:MAG: M4 family metallopeptidase [Saprospiraceae bacterium]|nr:M4 family metallopeptidase [Saprospiraceae bacterium]
MMNGRYQPTPQLTSFQAALGQQQALNLALADVAKYTKVKSLPEAELALMDGPQTQIQLVVYPLQRKPLLAWAITLRPNLASRWTYIIDAQSSDILQHFDNLCKVHGTHTASDHGHAVPPPDGPATANANDLFGISRTINTYQKGSLFYLIDASRSMFDAPASVFPDEPVGVIWTINAQNTSPENNNFGAAHITSSNNTWTNPIAVSAHYNAGRAFEYFKQTFNRNSINGQGGNIISLINVADPSGQPMDNAFWNGAAMFYGNGSIAFSSPLAKGLDVSGHEMSHGVIQNTANLEYYAESGAINESFADVFGAMIDRDDWLIGENVVNNNVYTSGALRSMSDPHNGGNSLNDDGWQPAHFSEKYTGTADNAGVHINSGITNRAYYLFAEQVSKNTAEQVYYRALNNYLTRSSQFIDLRIAVIQAATDLHGANSTVVNAAISAFSTVGIGAGQVANTRTI